MTTSRCVVITGAAGALGRAVTQRFASDGARVALLDRDAATLASLFPDAALRLSADITDSASVDSAAREVAQALGAVDALVHVAGGFEMGESVHGLSRAAWDRMMNLNAWSFACVAHAFVPLMRGRPGASLVAVSAASAAAGVAQTGAYVASKAALQRLVESLAQELRGEGVRVNSVAPTILDTPANRAAMPAAERSAWVDTARAADAIAFLASPAGATLNGQHLRLGS
jgi:NAD(P)-dependent dehydrogenase (short-subunit alcohol dehydrogenase family)